MSAGVRALYKQCSQNLLSTTSTDGVHLGADSIYVSDITMHSDFVVFGYLDCDASIAPECLVCYFCELPCLVV